METSQNYDKMIEEQLADDDYIEYMISGTKNNNQNSIQENKVDINKNKDYNNTEGVNENDEFRRLQEEIRGSTIETNQQRRSTKIDERERERIVRILQGRVQSGRTSSSTNTRVDVVFGDKTNPNKSYSMSTVDAKTFRDVFEVARAYTENGELVDLHNEKTSDDGIGYEDTINYLSNDGTSGFAITPDLDLISVFNAKKLNNKKGFLKAIKSEVVSKTKTLDCYASENQDLRKIYEDVLGFKTASVMDYNMDFDHDNIAKNHNMPQIAFMVNTDEEIETKHFTKDQYDEAVEYRNSF